MKKIVVIGAGPAGITAALELLKEPEQAEIVILEASDQIGGISKTVRHGKNRIDIGGHRFFSKDPEVMAWWNDILKYQGAPSKDDKILGRVSRLEKGGPDPEKTDDVFLIRHRVSRIYYNGKFFDYPISFQLQTFWNMGFITSMKAGFSYLFSCIHKRPEDSLENFYVNRFGHKLYAMFFEGYTEKVWGRHPRAISADWGAQRVKGLSIWALIKNMFGKLFSKEHEVETSLIEEFYYPKLGPGQLWEKALAMAQEKGARVVFHAKVNGFEQDEQGDIRTVITEDGMRYEADAVISSMPIKDLVASLQNVPERIQYIANGLPYRDFVTVGFLVDRLALKNTTKIKTLGDIVPDCWIYVQDTGVKLGRIQIFNNWSPYLLEDPEHTVWIGLEYFCNEGDAFWNLSYEACMELALSELRKIGVIDERVKIRDSCREKVLKAYPAYFDTYENIDELIAWLNKLPNLYCIGRNGQHRYNNMDHSMLTAFRAVEALRGKAEKKDLWSVNTEKSYHETKEKQNDK